MSPRPTTAPTPPSLSRAKLPSSSPSSARLRKLAPSPVKIPPTPPLFFTSPSRAVRRPSLAPSITSANEDPFEFDFAPLDLGTQSGLKSSITTPQFQNENGLFSREGFRGGDARRNSSIVSNGSVPLIFDSRGDFGALAQSSRTAAGPDVPEEMLTLSPGRTASVHHAPNAAREEWDGGAGDALLSPRDFLATTIPKKVLVEFRDVFGSGGATIPASDSGRTIQEDGLDPLDKSRTYREESDASFATFGGRRPSRVSGEDGDEDEGWEYTLSAYGSDGESASPKLRSSAWTNTPNPTPSIEFSDPFASYSMTSSSLIPQPSLRSFEDSPASVAGTEIITPDHTASDLPRTSVATTSSSFSTGVPAWTSDTPTPKPPRPFQHPSDANFNNNELGLDLGFGTLRSRNAGKTTTSTTWAEGGGRLPKKGTPHTKGRKRTPTLDEDLPPLPHDAIIPPPPSLPTQSLPKIASKSNMKTFPSIPIITSSPPDDDTFSVLVEKALKSIPRTTTIMFQVDQESTREVRTCLKYRKMHKPQVFRDREQKALEEAALWCESPTRVEMFQKTGCIEFGMDPKARAKWTFRHAALEGLPMIRRLMINDDEKWDYLPKGATLQIRDLGVYAVYGHEDKGRVEWKFEYLVQPRISPSTGELVPNEKFVIPLGFYCSPSFFDSDRALKVNLMTMFQKKITQNIVSEKVIPPRVGKPPETYVPPPTTPQVGAMTRTFGAIAKAVTGGSGGHNKGGSGNSTPTTAVSPISAMNILGKGLGSNGKGRPGSRARTPTVSEGSTEKDQKKAATRRRAISLFSKGRPTTAQINDASAHPMPALNAMKSLSALKRPHTGVNLNANIPSMPMSRSPLGLGTVVVPVMYSPSPPSVSSRGGDRGLRASHPFAHAIAEATIVHGSGRNGSGDATRDLGQDRGLPPPPRQVRGMVSSGALRVPEMRRRPSTAEPRLGYVL